MPEIKSNLKEFKLYWPSLNIINVLLRVENQRLAIRLGDVNPVPPSLEDRESLHIEVLTTWQMHNSLGGLSKLSMMKLPYVLFWYENSQTALVDNLDLLNAYLNWLRDTPAPKAVAALLDEFLFQYLPSSQWFEPVRSCLLSILSENDKSPRIRRIVARCNEYGFLGDDAPKKFGIKILQEQEDILGTLANAGLTGRRENGAFVEQVFLWYLDFVKMGLRNSQPIKKGIIPSFLDFSAPQIGTLRFEKHRTLLINTLLEPFSTKDEPVESRDQIFSFLIKCFGDPRINRGKWEYASHEAKAVIHRWLVKDTLDDFFVLLEKVAQRDNDASRMWRYRKAFWSAYLKKNVISNAWVVLGKDARDLARQFFKGKIDKYASLVGSSGASVSRLHSVLLMEVGGLLVAEWSHNGKCHIWHTSENPRPSLYSKEYRRDDLSCNFNWSDHDPPPFFHHGAERGTWQRSVSDFIRRHTNISLMQHEYMPRD